MVRRNLFNYSVAFLSGIAIGVAATFSGLSASSENSDESRVPKFRNVAGEYIGFRDDFADGMRATIFHKGSVFKIEADNTPCINYANFRIPNRVREGEFQIYATDKENNRSKVRKFSIREGKIEEMVNFKNRNSQ